MCLFAIVFHLVSVMLTFYAKMLAATASNIGNSFFEHFNHKDIGEKKSLQSTKYETFSVYTVIVLWLLNL